MGLGRAKMTAKDIRELMKRKGWNQATLPRNLEVTEGAVTRWLVNDIEPLGPARILMRLWLDQARAEDQSVKKQTA